MKKEINPPTERGQVVFGKGAKNNTVNINNTYPNEIQKLIDQSISKYLGPEAKELQQKLDVTESALKKFFTILRSQNVPLELLPTELEKIANRHRKALEHLEALSSDSPESAEHLNQIHNEIEQGNYNSARDLLILVKDAELTMAHKANELEVLANKAKNERYLNAANAAAQVGDTHMIEGDFFSAADCYKEASEYVSEVNPEHHTKFRNLWAAALTQVSAEPGKHPFLDQAIDIITDSLKLIDPIKYAYDWAITQISLGKALSILGEIDQDLPVLDNAIEAHKLAITILKPPYYPMDWALTQNELGILYSLLGELTSPPDISNFSHALAAYKAAQLVWTRTNAPFDWARLQNNIGNTLGVLGERQRDSNKICKGVNAIKSALRLRKREQVPADWAESQNNLGTILIRLANLQSDKTKTDSLLQAIRIFDNILEERTLTDFPSEWANTQNSKGIALRNLGKQLSDTEHLKISASCFTSANLVYGSYSNPTYYAQSQFNLGLTLMYLGKITNDLTDLNDAKVALNYSRAIFIKEERAPGLIRQIDNDLEAIEKLIAQLNSTHPDLI